MFQHDEETSAIVLIGEIGGSMEEEAAEYIKKEITKPVIGFIAGRSAPHGKRMGHAGAIIAGDKGKAVTKVAALQDAGAFMVDNPADIGITVSKILKDAGK